MSEGAATLLSVVKAITYIVFVIVLAGFLSYFVIRVANDMFAFVKSDEQVTVTIPEYATINEVSAVLAEEGIITYPEVFKLYAKLNHDDGKFKAGDYEINGMMNYDELLMAFKERFVRQRVRLTIPEGYTVDEIIDLFVENGVGLVEREKDVWVTATREDYIAAVNNLELYAEYFDFVRALIGNTSSDRTYQLEGYLFPDTYEFYTDSKPSQIVYKLLNRFNNVFKEEFYTRSQELGYTVDEIVILASMVEKEARLYNEFEQVSSVFHNRLRDPANFPYLESDATIMYAIHFDTGTRKEDMTAEDTDYVSPYNTYTNRGLPPGPIANPSYQAITCALYPEETDYYYFVSRKNGETVFSKTYPEHQAAVAAAARE
ncbi:MAG: endolytic transglycosylase MltG [Clostridia bacterium]|nr:endolytic transglycosylase MltG [Clostridia bacterium]